MSNTHLSANQLWIGLHNEVAALDRQSVLIKVAAALVLLIGLTAYVKVELAAIVGLLWICEACLRVYQARAIERLEAIEGSSLTDNVAAEDVYLHHCHYRPSKLGLIGNYVYASLKPTVAPYYLFIGVLFTLLV